MYEKILADTLDNYKKMPIVIPQKGIFVGFAREFFCENNEAFREDNYHFPMGTAFLRYGVKGIADKARKNACKNNGDKAELLLGIAEVYDCIAEYFGKYVTVLEDLIQQSNECERERLAFLQENMRTLSCDKPKTFIQGLQIYYLMWKIRSLFSFTGDLGRLDVHLKDLYEKDIAEKRITEDQALDAICQFYERLNENNSGDTLINISVGGVNPDGTDSTSCLSTLFLKATAIVKKTEPHINVRMHKNSPKEFVDAMSEVQYLGQGQGSVYFDDNVIPALLRAGFSKQIACCYTNDGCTEITFDGHSGIDFNHIDAVAALEATMNRGQYIARDYFRPVKYFHKDCPSVMYKPDIVYGFDSGDVLSCKTYDELFGCFVKQWQFQIRQKAEMLRKMHLTRKKDGATSLFLSGTFERVLDTGCDPLRGGFDVDYYQMFSGSITTVADNLCAIKRAVFDEKRYTLKEIQDAIAVNYDGYEPMRQTLLSYPKFGNDIDEVDQIASQIAEIFCDTLDDFYAETGLKIVGDLLGWRFLEESYGIAATYDGRKYAAPIAEHYCATPGRATNGPTAIINSIAKADLQRPCGVVAVHISLPRKLAETKQESLAVLKCLVNTAAKKGLLMVNIAIYDIEKLREAQRDPENNQDVIVRVWGYSAKFVDLCKEMQEHVISRILDVGA